MYNKKITFLAILLSFPIFGQVGINNNTPDSSSMLDIAANTTTNNKGLILPGVSLTSNTDNTTIASPAKGLVVYNTNGFVGEGIYVNEGTPASPKWQKMKLVESGVLSRFISTLAYAGATDPLQTVDSDTFQWRLAPSGTSYQLQARLKAAPGANVVTTPTLRLIWNSSPAYATSVGLPSFVWTSANWSNWQTLATYQSSDQSLFYFGIQGTNKLFRVNVHTITDSYNSLLIEQF